MRASLAVVSKKSGAKILTELASSFNDKDDYMRYLEGIAMIAFKDALCTVDECHMKVSHPNRADYAFGRAAAFLLAQELEIQRRCNIAVCGTQVEAPQDGI